MESYNSKVKGPFGASFIFDTRFKLQNISIVVNRFSLFCWEFFSLQAEQIAHWSVRFKFAKTENFKCYSKEFEAVLLLKATKPNAKVSLSPNPNNEL